MSEKTARSHTARTVARQAKDPEAWVSVKIPPSAYGEARTLQAAVRAEGWRRFGVDSDDNPSLGRVIEEALRAMFERARPK